ncbi:peptidoglycan-binding domain-containing protein [Kitasatospora aureofaciens]|uniref:peptidoglycan-binding domain-containing protein n=1 Tax=Kitasatospora aureofaciens TaxID=1894 RepID=UPI0033EFBBD0
MKIASIGARTFGALALACVTVITVSGSASASTSAGNLSYGDSGDAVRCVQYAVKYAGMGGSSDNVTADGQWGDNTEVGVEDFQRHWQLTSDGIVGPQTGQRMWETLKGVGHGYDYCFDLLPTTSMFGYP